MLGQSLVTEGMVLLYCMSESLTRGVGERLFTPTRGKQKGAPTGNFRFWYATKRIDAERGKCQGIGDTYAVRNY
jgi:hypothetical protein